MTNTTQYFGGYKARMSLPIMLLVAIKPNIATKCVVLCMLVFCNITNKIRKRTDTTVAFTQEYSRVLYTLGNVSTLPTGSGYQRTHTGVGG
jgi:hypothetical protein